MYLGPSEPMLDDISLSELETQPVTGPRPISLAAFANRAEYPVRFDLIPPTFVKYVALNRNSKMTEFRVEDHIDVEMLTALVTKSSDYSHGYQQTCSLVAHDGWDRLPFCDDAAQVGSDKCADLRRSSYARTPPVRLKPFGETTTCPHPSHSPKLAASETKQVLGIEQEIDASTLRPF